MKETEVILSSDSWRIAVELETNAYQEVITTIRSDFLQLGQAVKDGTSITELRQIEKLLIHLENKLHDFYQILPRLDNRRGLLNVGGTVLKTLFGTATIADVSLLHDTLDELKFRNSEIVHSVADQLTYVKKLTASTQVNTDAIANLSLVIKDNLIQSHARYQQVATDLLWLNLTIHGQSELFIAIRQLEFALLHLTQQLDELFNAVQCAMLGNLPISFINPTVLLNILKNVSLQIPEGFELVAGIRPENVYKYYELIKISVAATPHSVKLILNVPLKSVSNYFTLYRIITLPERVHSDKFVQYVVTYPYLGLRSNQHDYILLTEAQFNHCSGNSIVICPANVAVYSAQSLTCEFSLFSQATTEYPLCQRKLLLGHRTPILYQHGSLWIYYFPEQRLVTLHCPDFKTQRMHTIPLFGAGIIHNISSCYISTAEVQTLPQLRGSSQTELEAPAFYIPSKVPAISDLEVHQLENLLPAEVSQLDELRSQLTAHRPAVDIDTLFHIHCATQQSEQRTHWHEILVSIVSTITFLVLLGYLLRSHFKRCAHPITVPDPDTSTPNPEPLSRAARQGANSQAGTSSEGEVVFSAYAMHPANGPA
jgi:hypothetical protein